MPPKQTLLAPVSPVPLIVIRVPTGPLTGLKLDTKGTTLKTCLLLSTPEEAVTVTVAVVPEAGTTAWFRTEIHHGPEPRVPVEIPR
jgi:hypothetical protein